MLAETFEVDNSNTKRLLEGDRGQRICEKDIIVSAFIFFVALAKFIAIKFMLGLELTWPTEGDWKNLIIMVIKCYMSKVEGL